MRVVDRDNRELFDYLEAQGTIGHFARHVTRQAPDARSLAVESKSRAGGVEPDAIVGVAVSGVAAEVYEAPACWILADSPDVVHALFDAAHARGLRPFNVELDTLDRVAEVAPDLKRSVDRLYVLDSGRGLPPVADGVVTRLPPSMLRSVEIPDELRHYIGSIDALPTDFPLSGIVVDGRLVALAETAVRDARVVAIQQVVTIEAERRRGHARALVATLARDLLAEGLLPTYFVSEANLPSVRLAESLGFRLESRWGYVE